MMRRLLDIPRHPDKPPTKKKWPTVAFSEDENADTVAKKRRRKKKGES
jgi:hypothetical protein